MSDTHSEDGAPSEQTDTVSLVEPAGPDDVASLDGRSSSNQTDHDESEADGDEKDEFPPHDDDDDDDAAAIDGSGLTTKPNTCSDYIEFVEPQYWPEGQVQLRHSVRTFDGLETALLKRWFPYGHEHSILLGAVQQTVAKESLDTDKPFRVLYIGDVAFRNAVLDKIGDALVSTSSSRSGLEGTSTESGRFHVVPTSCDAGSQAELLPMHAQLIVDECVGATVEAHADTNPNIILLSFKNRPPCTSLWTGSGYRVYSPSDWTLPAVAIFFISSKDDATAAHRRSLAHAFMQRHGVPSMSISQEPLWMAAATEQPMPVNTHSIHLCLESRHAVTGETTILKRYPIDWKTFDDITPSQLNRNLASLATLYPKATTTSGVVTCSSSTMEHPAFSYLAKRVHEAAPIIRRASFYLIALTMAVSMMSYMGLLSYIVVSPFATKYTNMSEATSIVASTGGPASAVVVAPVDSVGQYSLSLRAAQSSLNLHPKAVEEGVTPIMDKQQQRQRLGFEIQTLGDFHVVIKPPQGSRSTKKRGRFDVQVHRHEQALPYHMTKLFDGVYSLQLDREDAHGLINITVTSVKPPLRQTTLVDFGTPWLKIANWKRAAQLVSTQLVREFGTAQAGVSVAYGRLYTDLQELMGDVVKKTHFLRQSSLNKSLDLASPWLKFANWKRAARVVSTQLVWGFGAAHEGLSEAYARLYMDLQEPMRNVVKEMQHFLWQSNDMAPVRRLYVDLQELIKKGMHSSALDNLNKTDLVRKMSQAAKQAVQQFSTTSLMLKERMMPHAWNTEAREYYLNKMDHHVKMVKEGLRTYNNKKKFFLSKAHGNARHLMRRDAESKRPPPPRRMRRGKGRARSNGLTCL